MVTMQSWMFLGSFEKMRNDLIDGKSIVTMAHLGPRAFDAIGGEVVSVTADVLYNGRSGGEGSYFRLVDVVGSEPKRTALLEAIQNPDCDWFHRADASTFHDIPGSPIAYWASEAMRRAFTRTAKLGDIASPRQGSATGDNDRFMRFHWEISATNIDFCSFRLKTPIVVIKNGSHTIRAAPYRKWHGNNDYVLAFDKASYDALLDMGNHLPSRKYYFQAGVTWSALSSGPISTRHTESGHLF